MKNRYRLILGLMLTALLAGGNVMAQVQIHGTVFGGGNAADVKTNTIVNIGGGTIDKNVYGGGKLGDVGIIDKTDEKDGQLTYNYAWKQSDGTTANTAENNKITDTNNNTGICKVTITGGTIGTGVEMSDDGTYANGNVFGAGKGLADTWWCEKAMVFATNVTISAGTVRGTVYGGGEVGRVEDDAKVTIGGTTITGNVFGAGAGIKTHGYSALVRGNSDVTVQGAAQVGGSVYGGGEIASVGRFTVVGGLPKHPDSGGTCKVTIQGNAKIGESGTGHNVFGACKGVTPAFDSSNDFKNNKSMQIEANRPKNADGTVKAEHVYWDYVETYDAGYNGTKFVWVYYRTETEYLAFLKTLALTSHPYVTIGGSANVYGSVYGGGERGVTLGHVNVDITGGTVAQDVYGGGALADTNLGNWDESGYVVATALNEGESITNLYARTGSGTSDSPYVYTKITNADTQFSSGTYYRQQATWTDAENKSALYTTTVNLHGGLINGDAYGGGLGQKERGTSGQDGYVPPIEALVYGDVSVNLGKANDDETPATAFKITYVTDDNGASVLNSGRVFGCNNLNGSPKANVTVTVNKTVPGKDAEGNNLGRTVITRDETTKEVTSVNTPHVYEVAAVYGGGNLANYTPEEGVVKVIINSCDVSINQVYGGGNAAEVPSTDVLVNGAHEIEQVFGGGNGKDKYYLNGSWHVNQGANVNGNANTLIKGGLVHEAYGGSNEAGNISGNVTIDTGTGGLAGCPLKVEKIVGAGKNADVNGDLIMIMGCKDATKIPIVYGGADNANVNGNVELTITSGHFGQVFGGNNLGGVIRGHIYLNIEETSECEPITIDDLYLGGNQAAYSRYGYYVKTTTSEGENATGVGYPKDETAVLNADNKLIFLPRKSADDPHKPVKTYDMAAKTWTVYDGTEADPYPEYEEPVLNVISCTSIGRVFGGGLGEGAAMYADPTVNINMILGSKATNNELGEIGIGYTDENSDRVEGGVFGGGNQAAVYGNTTVNIGTETLVKNHISYDKETRQYEMSDNQTVLGANIKSNVYGGGNEADVTGNTYVNICAKETGTGADKVWTAVPEGEKKVTIAGNVFGGGKGIGDSFMCAKAMVGVNNEGKDEQDPGSIDKGTRVHIGNGTVNGSVYGGGEIGRVEWNTVVAIGIGKGSETGARTPVIEGSVFGAGKGLNTHGYSALVRGDTRVTVEGNTWIKNSVYGGGEIASVGRYKVAETEAEGAEHGVEKDMPYTTHQGGKCRVTVQGYAEIGLNDMQMKKTGGPDDTGYVFGAGKGILPYEDLGKEIINEVEVTGRPRRMTNDDKNNDGVNDWEYYTSADYGDGYEAAYLKYIETLALTTDTYVTIDGYAFIKGSVYGGSENGHVQHNTDVKIQGHCQIGNGWDPTKNSNAGGGVNARYNETLFINPSTAEASAIIASANAMYECAHWDYQSPYKPYDKYVDSDDGAKTATDGHTFFGNVFGGGSGLYPYQKENGEYEWLRSAGRVYGNTNVEIIGGHILTSVYGGCELTDVGNGVSLEEGDDGKINKGKCTVKMSGGTLGVPRTLSQIAAHPVTCYLFGAGKGDQRTRFNQWTNVGSVEVEVSGTAIIYGSVFGGGEDGHVLGDVDMNISGGSIGTWGTSYVEGNVFGGGRGFGGDALTAGVVCGNVDIDIQDGTMLGSIYGGGRLGSVGTYLVPATDSNDADNPHPKYGKLIPDGEEVTIDEANGTVTTATGGGNHGHITIDISGGTIGNRWEYTFNPDNTYKTTYVPKTEYDSDNRLKHTKGGNVFAGSMGRLKALDDETYLRNWEDLGKAKSTKVTVRGGTIKSCVYGGGELGAVEETHVVKDENGVTLKDSENHDIVAGTEVVIKSGASIGTVIENASEVPQYTFGSVFGGGYGSTIEEIKFGTVTTYPKLNAGIVKEDTRVIMEGGTVLASVYGGGEVASVKGSTNVEVSGGIIGKDKYSSEGNTTYFGGATMGNVYGGGSGYKDIVRAGKIWKNTNVKISGGTIYHNVYGGGAYGTVGDFIYGTTTADDGPFAGIPKVSSVDGLQTENTGTATVTVTGGTIGVDGKENGMVFGSSRGDVGEEHDDWLAWVYNTYVTIGTQNSEEGPLVKGSVYGSGENGHTYNNTVVNIHSGKVGITEGSEITSKGVTYSGAKYPYRGNVYGGGCGTDTYTGTDGKEYYNPLAGVVYGTTTVNMDGGHVVHNLYGAGAMGSVGMFTFDADTENTIPDGKPISCSSTTNENSGLCTITISGGKIGMTDMQMPDNYGHVFGAGRGEVLDPADYPNLKVSGYVNNTHVTITGSAFVTGSVYGGGESGHVLGDTQVTVSGGQIGFGKETTAPYSDWTSNTMKECPSWPYEAPYAPYDKFANASGYYDTSNTKSAGGGLPTGSDGHTFYGNVFGGGSGYEPYAAGAWERSAGLVEGNTKVEITGGHILTSVYGGNEQTDVGHGLKLEANKGKCTVTMEGGTVGVPLSHDQRSAHPVTGNLFGAGKGDKRLQFNTWTNVGETEVTISGGTVYGSVFGGGEDGHVLGNATTTIKETDPTNYPTVIGTLGTTGYDGNVFGGGRGSESALTAGVVCGSVSLNIEKGMIMGSVYGGGRLASLGTYLVPPLVDGSSDTENSKYGKQIPDGYNQVIGGDNVTASGATHGHVNITISGGTIGALDNEDNLKNSLNSIGDVFGGCKGTTDDTLHDKLGVSTNATINFLGGTVHNAIYGGGEVGNVGELGEGDQATSAFAKINLLGGSVVNVYGGGLGKKTSTIDAKALVKGNVTVNLNGLEAGDYDAAIHSTIVEAIEEDGVNGVDFYRLPVANRAKGCKVLGNIFGCNNVNGTPTGHSKVHVFMTTPKTAGQLATEYDISAIYGGGNQADYDPVSEVDDNKQSTEVIIEGCGLTKIQQVYGGGNAAASPGTSVLIKGTELIDEVFGGGNGVSTETFENPGANVGYHTDKSPYAVGHGDGKTYVQLMAGTVHNVYGGSNSNGDIRGGSSITKPTPVWKDGNGVNASCCQELAVDQIFGGGKNADMRSGAEIVMGCMPDDWIGEIYAGAEMANVKGNVSLTLTSGKFGRVFGGNKTSGILDGSIMVNIDENGNCSVPIVIGELYGGGNMAAYSIYGYEGDEPRTKAQYDALTAEQKAAIGLEKPHASPVVNVHGFTSIGNIFGGGYGEDADMYGSPTVNINEVMVVGNKAYQFANDNSLNKPTTLIDGVNVKLYDHDKDKMGVIGNVFGGGNAALVDGNTTVNIATEENVYVVKLVDVDDPVNGLYKRVKNETTGEVTYTLQGANDKAVEGSNYYQLLPVQGADIRGNVYGGGNKANVTGSTKVNIGKATTTP